MAQQLHSNDIADWLQFAAPGVAQLPQPHPGYPTPRYSLASPPVSMLDKERNSRFGYRKDPFLGTRRYHSGDDIGRNKTDKSRPMPEESRYIMNDPVFATNPGEVVYAGLNGGYGKTVEIKHADGMLTRYAHLNDINVAIGDKIEAGWTIGKLGSTGRSTGPHLHFEVEINGKKVDPGKYLAKFDNPPMPTPVAKPDFNAPLGVVEVADLPDLLAAGTPLPAQLPSLPDPVIGSALPSLLPSIPETPLNLQAGPAMAYAGIGAAANLGSLGPVAPQLDPLEAGPVMSNAGSRAAGNINLGPQLPEMIEPGLSKDHTGASASAMALPGSLAPEIDDRVTRAILASERPIGLPDYIGASNTPSGPGADSLAMALHGSPQMPSKKTVAMTPSGRIDVAFDAAGLPPVSNLPGSLAPDPITPRMVTTERIQTTDQIPQAHPGYPGQPSPMSRPEYAGPPMQTPGLPVPRSAATPMPVELAQHSAPALPTPRSAAAPMPTARASAVPALPTARPELEQTFASTSGLGPTERVLSAHELAAGLPQYDPTTQGAPMVNGVPAAEYSKALRTGTQATPVPSQLPAIPTINNAAPGLPQARPQDPTIPTVGIPSSVPGSLGPVTPGGTTTVAKKQDKLPSAVEIVKESHRARRALGIAGALAGGIPGAIAGAGLGTWIDRGGLDNFGSGWGGVGGNGAVDNAIYAGAVVGGLGGGGYNQAAARQTFMATPGAQDAQTLARFDWENYKARQFYGQQGGAGAGNGISEEAQNAIDAAEAAGRGGLW